MLRKHLPFSQRTKAVGGDVILTPKGEVGVVGSANDVGEMRQPNGERVVLWMCLI